GAERTRSEGLPAMAGSSPEADPPRGTRCRAIVAITAVAAAATIFFGVVPSPLVDWAANAGEAIEASFG
ncbi:MAG: hypothetical protein ACRDKX_02980, partial [Solirubrobacterales bacterium]